MKREEIFLAIGGAVAAAGIGFLFYRLQSQQAAQAAQNEADNSAAIESQLANQQAAIASIPSYISNPVSNSVSSNDVTQQSTGAPTTTDAIEKIVTAFQANTPSDVHQTITPIASIGLLSNNPVTPLSPTDALAQVTSLISNASTLPMKDTSIKSTTSNVNGAS